MQDNFDNILFGAENDPHSEVRYDRYLDGLKTCLSTKQGRRFLYEFMLNLGIDEHGFGHEREATDFNCGRRSAATDLRVLMDEVNPDAYWLMIKEAKEDKAYDNGQPNT